MIRTVSDPLPDSAYSFWRLGLALIIATISNVGMWAVIVVLPAVKSEFGIARGAASFPYTMAMVGFATGTLALGLHAGAIALLTERGLESRRLDGHAGGTLALATSTASVREHTCR